jgi:hypothetical protein
MAWRCGEMPVDLQAALGTLAAYAVGPPGPARGGGGALLPIPLAYTPQGVRGRSRSRSRSRPRRRDTRDREREELARCKARIA